MTYQQELEAMTDGEEKTYKWFWLMSYCKNNNIPPAQSWAWELAKAAYETKRIEAT